MEAMMFFELGCVGQREMSVFQGLSGGNTCSAARMRSACGVSNITGRVMAGIFGSGRPLEWLAVGESSRFTAAVATPRQAAQRIRRETKGVFLTGRSSTKRD